MALERTESQNGSLCKTCHKQISNRDAIFHGVSCGESGHLTKSCAGFSESRISEIRNINQIVLLICNQCVTNNQQDRALDNNVCNRRDPGTVLSPERKSNGLENRCSSIRQDADCCR